MRISQSKWLSASGICTLFILFAFLFVTWWHGASANAAPAGKSWKMVPNPSGPYTIYGISAGSASDVWMVGGSNNSQSSTTRTLTEHWDGTKWSVVHSPNFGKGFYNLLQGVAAISASDAWAVGGHAYDNNPLHVATLIEHWDGTKWRIVPGATISSTYSNLTAVAGLSSTDVWAAGSYRTNNGDKTLIEHWNGKTWSHVTTPGYADLASLTVISDTDIWAAGGLAQSGQYVLPFLLHWNGTSWGVVPPAQPQGIQSGFFSSISASAGNNVWASGGYWDGTNAHYLTERWDGSTWSVVPVPGSMNNGIPTHIAPAPSIPQSGGPYHELTGITVISPTDVWSVGGSTDQQGVIHTYIIHWNGTIWSVVSSPNVPHETNMLMGISGAAHTGQLWAAGFAINSQGVATALTLLYS